MANCRNDFFLVLFFFVSLVFLTEKKVKNREFDSELQCV